MKHCPNGCMILPVEDNFCYKCGAKQVPLETCSCGKQLVECDKFCPGCGKKTKTIRVNATSSYMKIQVMIWCGIVGSVMMAICWGCGQ